MLVESFIYNYNTYHKHPKWFTLSLCYYSRNGAWMFSCRSLQCYIVCTVYTLGMKGLMFCTSIWCKIKGITSTVLYLISLSIFSACLLDNVFFNPIVILHLFRMDSCFDKILEGPAKQDCRFLSKPLCRHNFFPTPAENDT